MKLELEKIIKGMNKMTTDINKRITGQINKFLKNRTNKKRIKRQKEMMKRFSKRYEKYKKK